MFRAPYIPVVTVCRNYLKKNVDKGFLTAIKLKTKTEYII